MTPLLDLLPLRRRRRVGRKLRLLGLASIALLAALVAAGCGDDDGNGGSDEGGESIDEDALVIYSGRGEGLVGDLFEQFSEDTGIEVSVRYGKSAELAAQLEEEGADSPADAFYAQDAGTVGSLGDQLMALPDGVLQSVPEAYRSDEGRWVGITGRVRTLVFNTEELEESELPESVFDLVEPEWEGRLGVAPTNASFLGFVTAMRLELGDERTREFLEGLAENDAQIYEKNGPIVEAVATGEVEVGLVNHYYLYERLASDPDAPIANHFFPDDLGSFVNVSALGVLASTDREEDAVALAEWMLDQGQVYVAEELEEREYPLVEGVVAGNSRYEELPPLEEVGGTTVDLTQLGDELEATVDMVREAGLVQ